MPTTCWPSIRGTAMRLTKLDACGVPVVGPKSSLISDGFISISLSPQYEDGEETRQKNAAGKLRVTDKADDELVGFDTEISLVGVNPDLFNLWTGQPVVLDGAGASVGNRFGSTVSAAVALEVWTDVPGTACVGGDKPYGYFLLPFLYGGRLNDFTIESALANFTVSSRTKEGAGWGTGPYDVVMSTPPTPVAGPLLTAIGPKEHMHMQVTTVAPPTIPVDCGAVALAP